MLLSAFAVIALAAFTSCSKNEDEVQKPEKQESKDSVIVQNILSEYSVIDKQVADQKASSKKDKAVLLVAFGSTWDNAFKAFDATKAEYEREFPDADVYVSFSSDICINRASAGENVDPEGNIVKRDYYAPIYWLHAIGKAEYADVYVQSLQVIPGEEFAAVVASVKKFANNGFIKGAHISDEYLANVNIHLGLPLLNDPDVDVPAVAEALNNAYSTEAATGAVAFMGHGNPDSYDTFKANVRYEELETALKSYSPNYFVGTVDMPNNYKQNVWDRMKTAGLNDGKMTLHALMSIAGDHAHNDMAGEGDEYWDEDEPESEDNSWYEFFKNNGYTVSVTDLNANGDPKGLLELPAIRRIWIEHTRDAELLEDAYHSMYPEE